LGFDTIIRNGTIIDGSKQPRFKADVGITGGRIEAIGDLGKAEAKRVIDAKGMIVVPGFIDMHSHSDRTIIDDPGGESKVHQGVTTDVVGNCSYSPFPVPPGGPLGGYKFQTTNVEWGWSDLAGWAKMIEEKGVSMNIAPQAGHAAVRAAAGLLDNRPPTPDEMANMRRLTAEAVEQGAFAFTTGLTLPPGSYATTDEIVSIVEAIKPYDGAFYATHARLWANNHVGAVKEAVEVGRRTGVPVQYSHMAIIDSRVYGQGETMTDPIERAHDRGMDVTYDMYPYTAAGSHLAQLIPDWVQEGGVVKMLERLRTPAIRKKAIEDTRKGWFKGLPWEFDSIVIASVSSEKFHSIVGKSVAQIAKERKADPHETYLTLIDENDNNVGAVFHNRVEGDVRYFMGHPLAMIGSDGSAISPSGKYSKDKPHPRFYGTYPRILGRYIRQKPSVMTLEEAIYKMTAFPAKRMRFKDRGVIKIGYIADITIFNPDTVIDNATFDNPHQLPTGVPHVLVGGEPVVSNGKHTGARPGKVLRRGSS